MTGKGIYDNASHCAAYLLEQLPAELRAPTTGIICGSGLGGLADRVLSNPRVEIPYGKIPNFPQSTVEGHVGALVFGLLGESRTPVVLMVGRVHFYEGHSIQDVAFPVRVMKLLGVKQVIVTNAAGGLNPEYKVGDIVILSDHLNLAGISGIHPLRGPNIDKFGTRFPPLSDAYDLSLRRLAHRTWQKNAIGNGSRALREGVYAFVGGPSYETRAECRMLQLLGADLVGMSTVPEIIVARHSGMKVLAMSLVTNCSVLDPSPAGNDPAVLAMDESEMLALSEAGKANHEEVLAAGKAAAIDLQQLVSLVVDQTQ